MLSFSFLNLVLMPATMELCLHVTLVARTEYSSYISTSQSENTGGSIFSGLREVIVSHPTPYI